MSISLKRLSPAAPVPVIMCDSCKSAHGLAVALYVSGCAACANLVTIPNGIFVPVPYTIALSSAFPIALPNASMIVEARSTSLSSSIELGTGIKPPTL